MINVWDELITIEEELTELIEKYTNDQINNEIDERIERERVMNKNVYPIIDWDKV